MKSVRVWTFSSRSSPLLIAIFSIGDRVVWGVAPASHFNQHSVVHSKSCDTKLCDNFNTKENKKKNPICLCKSWPHLCYIAISTRTVLCITLRSLIVSYRTFFFSAGGERKLCDSIFPSLLSVHFDSIPFSSHTTHIRFRFTEQKWKHETFFIKFHIHSAIVSKRWSFHFWSLCPAYTHTISATSSNTPIYCNSFILFHFIFYE